MGGGSSYTQLGLEGPPEPGNKHKNESSADKLSSKPKFLFNALLTMAGMRSDSESGGCPLPIKVQAHSGERLRC